MDPLRQQYPQIFWGVANIGRGAGGKALELQRGGGLCVVKSTRQKEYAASIFAQWLTDENINVPFVTTTGYLPVKQAAYRTLMQEGATSFINGAYKELYATVSAMQGTHAFYSIPPVAGYGEMEKAFTEAQIEIFGRYGNVENQGNASSQELTRKMFAELKLAMQLHK